MQSQFNTPTPRSEQFHLTDEQFADLLLGSTPSAVQVHLSMCTQCAEEAERVSGAIGSFEQQTRLWAERRTATHPVLTSVPRSAFAWLHVPAGPQAWTAAALAVALAAGFGVAARNHRAPAVPAGNTQTTVQTATAQTADVQTVPAPAAHTPAAQTAVVQSMVAQAEPAPRVSPARLKADNDLLSAIDGELRADESTPARAYGLTVAAHGVRSRAADGMINE
jgi:hypothetical protein